MEGASSYFHLPPAEVGKYSDGLQPGAYIAEVGREFFGDEPASPKQKQQSISIGRGSSGAEVEHLRRSVTDFYHGPWPDVVPHFAEHGSGLGMLKAVDRHAAEELFFEVSPVADCFRPAQGRDGGHLCLPV